jgi:hypothetical protein
MYLNPGCGLRKERGQQVLEHNKERAMSTQHIDDGGRHIEQLDHRLRDLSAAFADLGTSDDFEEVFRIIHFPGWTTVIDVFFMNTLIDSAERAVNDARLVRKALLEGAQAIGEASAGQA